MKRWLISFLILLMFYLILPGSSATSDSDFSQNGSIIFRLFDEDNSIIYASLSKVGRSDVDGRSEQSQHIAFNIVNQEIIWTPCNDYACTISSFPSSGGTTGPLQLMMTIVSVNPDIDTSSCYGDSVCERLKGATITKSGLLQGIFSTGKTYDIYISSLNPGIREPFVVKQSI